MHASPQELRRIQQFLARCGTSHYLPTTVTASIDATLHALEQLASAIDAPTPPDEATPIGIHLEGPFLSHAKRGVHPAHLLQPPSIPLFDRFQQAARGHIKLLTIAPEIPGAIDLISHATQQGVRVSLGHTNATAAEAAAAIPGPEPPPPPTPSTPCDRSTTANPAYSGSYWTTRTSLPNSSATASTSRPRWCGSGSASSRRKPSSSPTPSPPPAWPTAPTPWPACPSPSPNGKATLTDSPGTLAGSVLTLDRAVANLQDFTGCTLEDAIRCASSHPAEFLGLSDTIASLRPSQPASFNQYTAPASGPARLEATYLHGQRLDS